jgi:hypothetical protein
MKPLRIGHKTRSTPSFIYWARAVDLSIARLEVRPSMLPRLVDGGSHIVSQDDELRRPAVVMAAKSYDLDFGHSGFHRRFRPVRRSNWIFVYVTPHWKCLNRCPHG